MEQRHTSWLGSISEVITYEGPTVFTGQRLREQPDLFAHRAALFYTPTDQIPTEYRGHGALHAVLPLASPDWTECEEIRAYMAPRLWVDLIQRATGKLRWCPMCPARVTIVRYDCWSIRDDHLKAGTKAVVDALKAGTTGRPDGRLLYYFGAIVDDAPEFMHATYLQRATANPSEARLEIRVEPANTASQPIVGKPGSG